NDATADVTATTAAKAKAIGLKRTRAPDEDRSAREYRAQAAGYARCLSLHLFIFLARREPLATRRERASQTCEREPRDRAAAAFLNDRDGRLGDDDTVAARVLERQHREVRRVLRAVIVEELAGVGVVELDEHVVEAGRVARHELGLDLVVVVVIG